MPNCEELIQFFVVTPIRHAKIKIREQKEEQIKEARQREGAKLAPDPPG
jgi:hypothetical protein